MASSRCSSGLQDECAIVRVVRLLNIQAAMIILVHSELTRAKAMRKSISIMLLLVLLTIDYQVTVIIQVTAKDSVEQ